MKDLANILKEINQMSELALSMLKTTFAGFIEHDVEMLAGVLKDEHRLNDTERAITLSLVNISRGNISPLDKSNIMLLTDIVAGLEEIGDYIKDMIERIEIKIQEKLLFSDEALDEYKHLYVVVETALSSVVNSLKNKDNNFAKHVLSDEEHVDILVEKYREAHAQRLIAGICDPRTGNMFLNLLDFTAQIFHHTKAIAKNILELK